MANRKTVKIYRSNKSLEAQLLDANKTLLGKKYFFNIKGDSPIKQSFAFGEDFGAALIKKGADKISFDRNSFKYHGRVKSFAEGLRKAKVEF
jgi:large subunit ribosomal protein L18